MGLSQFLSLWWASRSALAAALKEAGKALWLNIWQGRVQHFAVFTSHCDTINQLFSQRIQDAVYGHSQAETELCRTQPL